MTNVTFTATLPQTGLAAVNVGGTRFACSNVTATSAVCAIVFTAASLPVFPRAAITVDTAANPSEEFSAENVTWIVYGHHSVGSLNPPRAVLDVPTTLSVFGENMVDTDEFIVRVNFTNRNTTLLPGLYYKHGPAPTARSRVCSPFVTSFAETTVTVRNPGASDLVDFQVRVALPAATLALRTGSCTDLRVWSLSDQPRRPLPFWLQEDDCGTSLLRLWVLMPLLPAGVNVSFHVYSGCASCSASRSDPNAVFPEGFHVLSAYNFRQFVPAMNPAVAFNDTAGALSIPGGQSAAMVPSRTRFTLAPFTAVEFGFRHRPSAAALPDCPQPLVYLSDSSVATVTSAGLAFAYATCSALCSGGAACTACSLPVNQSSTAQAAVTFSVSAEPSSYQLRFSSGAGASCSAAISGSFVAPFVYVHSADANAARTLHLRWMARRAHSPAGLVVSAVTRPFVTLVEVPVPAQNNESVGVARVSLVEVSQNGIFYPPLPSDVAPQTVTWRSAAVLAVSPTTAISDGRINITVAGSGAFSSRSTARFLLTRRPGQDCCSTPWFPPTFASAWRARCRRWSSRPDTRMLRVAPTHCPSWRPCWHRAAICSTRGASCPWASPTLGVRRC